MNYNRCNGCKRFYIVVAWLRVYVVYVVRAWGIMRLGVVTRIVWVCLIL